MAAILTCERCKAVNEHKSVPIKECPKCGAAYPQDVRAPVERSLALQKPALITVGTFLAGFIGVFSIVTLSVSFLGIGGITYQINGQEVTPDYFFSHAGPWLGLTAVVMALIVYGFWANKAWSRHLAVLVWMALAVAAVLCWSISPTFIWCAVLAAFAVWYFYFKRNVTAFFAAHAAGEAKAG